MALEDPRDVVELQDYDPLWVSRFEEERLLLDSALRDMEVILEHVGSTAVPGLPAKPVIDILAAVVEQRPIAEYSTRLSPLGYAHQWQGDEPQRIFYRKGMPRTHHLHFVVQGSRQYWQLWRFH